MRSTLPILVVLALHDICSAQLVSPVEKRPQIPENFELTSKTPADLAGRRSLKFVELGVVFDGGSYGAVFRRDDGHDLAIYFLHPGYWTKHALTSKTQPIVVDLNQHENKVKFEVERESPFERRVIELLDDDLANRVHTRDEIKTLTRIRDCIRDRKPLAQFQRRFPDVFKDK